MSSIPASKSVHEIKITYQRLVTYHFAKLDAGVVKNHQTALDDWLSNKGLTVESVIGDEFGDRFEEELDAHLLYLENKPHVIKGAVVRGLSSGTIDNRSSLLKRWRRSWHALLSAEREKAEREELPDDIHEALKHLVSSRGMTPRGFAVAAGVDDEQFRRWYLGKKNPSEHPNTTEALEKIARYCGLEEGALTSLVRPTYKGRYGTATAGEHPRSTFAVRQMTASHEKYKLHAFPPALKAEWDALYGLMTPALEPDGPLRRNSYWYVDPETKKCPTASKVMTTLAGFFGYLSLPVEGQRFKIPEKNKGGQREGENAAAEHMYTTVKGEGLAADALTLALLSDVPLVKRYIEFVKDRAGGVYNTETGQIIDLCCMLLRKETGFVRQQAHLGARLSPPVPADRWDEWCEDARKRLREQFRKLKANGLVVQSRDVDEPIDFILKDDHPIHYLYRLADLMESDLPVPATKKDRAVAYRDMFLVRFLTANPLRVKHFSRMTWRADNTGNLYQERDGSWWLRFPKHAFKNRQRLNRETANKKYEAPLPASLRKYVEKYLFTHRLLLLGAGECDYVFRPSRRGGASSHNQGDTNPMTEDSLADVLRNKARYYLRCIGFGPHAYRHIIATDYLKNHPSGIMVAASILHDTPEMVLKHYGHLQHADFFKHWLRYHEKQLKLVRGEEPQEFEEAA